MARPFSAVPNIFASEGTGTPNNIPLLDADFAYVMSLLNDFATGFPAYLTDTGTANNYVVTLPSTPSAYTAYMLLAVTPANTNTGSSVINVNSLGNVSLLNSAGNALSSGDIQAGIAFLAICTGTAFRIISPIPSNILPAINPAYNRVWYDDFLGAPNSITTNGTSIPSQLPWTSRIAGSGNIIEVNTGVDATNICAGVTAFFVPGNGNSCGAYLQNFWSGLGAMEVDFRFLVDSLPTNAQNYTVYFGIVAPTFAVTDNVVLVLGQFTAGSAQFFGQCSSGSVTTTTSGLAWTSPNAIRIKILINAAWNSVSFFAGGSQIGSAVTTNIPSGKNLVPFFSITKTAGASAMDLYMDQFYASYQYAS